MSNVSLLLQKFFLEIGLHQVHDVLINTIRHFLQIFGYLPSTKLAADELSGVVKFGKRVLYDKAAVLNWLRSQTRQPAPSAAELEQAAEEQISRQLAKKGGKAA